MRILASVAKQKQPPGDYDPPGGFARQTSTCKNWRSAAARPSDLAVAISGRRAHKAMDKKCRRLATLPEKWAELIFGEEI